MDLNYYRSDSSSAKVSASRVGNRLEIGNKKGKCSEEENSNVETAVCRWLTSTAHTSAARSSQSAEMSWRKG